VATGQKSTAGPLFTLFHAGAVGSLSDRELLERFASGEADLAALAFTALVERHGPMVLRVCSALLRDPHDAQDAFQATFLVLIRKSPELWVHDSLGPWLHRVARRTAERAQARARRRRACERRAAELRTVLDQPPQHDPTWSVLHEEIDRLPERLRVLVVLCHLEGRSQDMAAQTLSLPIGTVKSRLHRARELLRGRLCRRGVAFSAGLFFAKPVRLAADPLRSLPLYESMVHAASRAGVSRAGRSSLVKASAIHLFQETIKTMFLTRIKIGVALALLAGCLALGAAGVFAQQGAGTRFTPPPVMRGREGKSTGPAAQAPAYIRRSRSMIIERLEQELSLAEGRLDLTTANVRTPNDPEVVRARKTVETLAGLLKRVDGVLIEAVDEFPTIFDFSNAPVASGAPMDRGKAATADATPKPPDGTAPGLPYDEHSLAEAAERMEFSRRQSAKGFVTKRQHDRNVERYNALKETIDADIARCAARVDWAKRMHEKGYVSEHQYETEVLKHYNALKARSEGDPQAAIDAVMKRFEQFRPSAVRHPPVPDEQTAPAVPEADLPAGGAEVLRRYELLKLKPPQPDRAPKPASDAPRAE
jgi:RNA polymerase sigma factor (sigma-70 family)